VASSVSQGHDLLFLSFGQMSERYLHAELVVPDPGDGSSFEDLVAFLDIAGSKESESLARRRLDFEGGPVVFSMMMKLGWMEVCSASLPLGTSSLVEVDAIYGGLLEKAQRTSDYKFLR